MQNAIPASQRRVSITRTDRLPLCMEIVATYCETYVKRKKYTAQQNGVSCI